MGNINGIKANKISQVTKLNAFLEARDFIHLSTSTINRQSIATAFDKLQSKTYIEANMDI